MKSVIVRAKEFLKQASETEKGIIRFILANPEKASHISTHELARQVFASPSTIGRLCRKLGFKDYREYQRALVSELTLLAEPVLETDFEIGPRDSVEAIIGKTLSRVNTSLEDTRSLIDSQTVENCVKRMVLADQIAFFGVGASLLVAKDAFLKFLRVKKHCQISDDFDVQLVMAKTMGPLDLAVLVSYSGKTRAIVECARQLKENQVPIIAITCFRESELSKLAEYNLYVSATEYAITSGKFTSRMAQLMVVDILYLSYLQATYATSQDALMATHIEKGEKGETEDGAGDLEPERIGHRDPK